MEYEVTVNAEIQATLKVDPEELVNDHNYEDSKLDIEDKVSEMAREEVNWEIEFDDPQTSSSDAECIQVKDVIGIKKIG